MKILVVWYDIFGYANSISNAFKANSVEADSFVIQSFTQRSNCIKHLGSKLGLRCFIDKYNKQVRDEIIYKCEHEKYTHILVLNGNYVDILDDYFFTWATNTNTELILWFVDSARNYNVYTKEYFYNYKKIYSFEPLDLEHLRKEYDVKNVTYLPLGADGNVYCSMDDREKEYDICFVGSGTEKRNDILEVVADFCNKNNKKIVVYGQFWRFRPMIHKLRSKYKLKRQYPNLYKVVVNQLLTPMEVAKLYRSSRICLNIVQNVHSATNPRTFEILATRGFQLVDNNPAIESLLKDGQHLVIYRDNNELVQLLKYYLDNEKDREDIAEAGFFEVENKFLMQKLTLKMMEEM